MLGLVVTLVFGLVGLSKEDATVRGPTFDQEPPPRVDFDNSTGAQIKCSAKGYPIPEVWWETFNGSRVRDTPSIQHVRPDGSMVFGPFSPMQYRREIHDAVYRCVAANAAGKMGSREVRVRAVLQDYKVTAYDAEFVIKGNIALLRCDISGNGKEYVFVTSWMRDDGLTISLNDNNGKYAVFASGEFHVRHIEEADALRKYRCQVHNKLSRETRLSDQWAKIIMTEPHGSVPPRVVHWKRDLTGQNGETIWIPCVAHGYPVPSFRWYRQDSNILTSFSNNHRIVEQEGMLVIHRSTLQDSGKYVCVVNNSKGQEKVITSLTVRESLRALVSPSHTLVTVGTSLSLRCEVSGSPILYLKWMKNLKPLVLDNRIRQQSNNVLDIANVRLGDEGLYQCFIDNSEDSAQGSATVLIQADPPVLNSRFEEQTVSPGRPVSLRCIASGHPLPKITWTADGDAVPQSPRLRLGDFVTQDGGVVHSFLNISSVDAADGKDYACHAESDFGRVTHSARLNVPSSPVGRPPQNRTALVGQTATFVCPVAGYPLTHYAWEKDGESLPNSHRHEVRKNGKIVIQYVEKNTDDGTYWCTAGNNRGVSARGRIDVSVVAGPVVDPFNFPENLREGRRTTLTCMVSAGDPPIAFRWEKDGEPLQPAFLGVSVEYINQFTSTLFFEKASRKHNGNYTCIASNPYAAANHTASLVLNIPPRWIIEPKDVEVVQASSVRVDCQADGFPRPIIRWKQLVGAHGNPESFQTIMSSARMQVLENGSLLILEASPSDGGSFLCQAFNRIGPGLSKMLTITVHVPAHFKAKFSAQKAKKGDQVNLNCKAQGDKPISITWYKDGEVLPNGTIPRYSKRQFDHHDGLTSQLSIHSVRREDSSVFSCRASNRYGHDDSTVELVVQEAPDHPSQVEVVHISSRSMHIRWVEPFNGNSPIVRFLIVTENAKGSEANIVTTDVSGTQMDTTLRGLRPRTTYNIHILAENAIGRSPRSKILSVTTDDEVPRTPPLQVKVVPDNSKSLKVSWLPPEGASDGGGSITGYYVGYKASKMGGQYLFKTLKVTDEFENECVLSNLQSSTEYSIVVQAFNEKGPGPQSDEIIAETSKFNPPKSPSIEVVKTTSNSIHIRWERTENVEGYLAYIREDNGEWKEATLPSEILTYKFENLNCGSVYQIYMVPFASGGKGDRSQVLTIKTDGRAPSSPLKEQFLQVNSSSVTVYLSTWDDGGCPIVHYFLRYRAQTEQTWTEVPVLGHRPRAFITGLNPGQWYKLLAGARNSAGNKDVEFDFLTRRIDLGKTQGIGPLPPVVAESSAMELQRRVAVITSAVCSAVVLVVILIAACAVLTRRRRHRPDGQDSGADRRSTGETQKSSETVALSAWEKRPEASHRGSQCRESLYLPCPYATARLSQFAVDDHHANEHSYDVPIQVVSKLH